MSIFKSLLQNDGKKLIKEDDFGNIEYKLRLDEKGLYRLKQMVTQILWRLYEGKESVNRYEAHYILGVYDDGEFGKLSRDELDISIEIYKECLSKANVIIDIEEYYVFGDSNIYYAKIKKKPEEKTLYELKIKFLGSHGSGKTSIISTLTYNQLDDGKGFARKLILHHEHEKISGETSSIKKEMIGIKDSNIINYETGMGYSWEDIVKVSDKVINIYDIPGNFKYNRTILYAISAITADAIYLVLDCSDILKDKDFIIFLLLYYEFKKIPVILILNKIDLLKTEKDNEEIIENIKKIYNYHGDIILTSTILDGNIGIKNIYESIKNIKKIDYDNNLLIPYFKILDTYFIPDTGTVVAGQMECGKLCDKDDIVIFDNEGSCCAKIGSISKKYKTFNTIISGESGSINIFFTEKKKDITKNAIISTKYYEPIYLVNFVLNILPITKISLFNIGHKYSMFNGNNISNFIITDINLEEKKIYVKSLYAIKILLHVGLCIIKNNYNEITSLLFNLESNKN
jgi:small GTP-binding protein